MAELDPSIPGDMDRHAFPGAIFGAIDRGCHSVTTIADYLDEQGLSFCRTCLKRDLDAYEGTDVARHLWQRDSFGAYQLNFKLLH